MHADECHFKKHLIFNIFLHVKLQSQVATDYTYNFAWIT